MLFRSGTTAALLTALGVDVPDERDPRDLSEGQRLALVLAVQLAARPPVLLLDEPTRGLDYRAKAELHRIVDRLAATGVAGSACVEELLRQDLFDVRILVRRSGMQERSSSGALRSIDCSHVSSPPRVFCRSGDSRTPSRRLRRSSVRATARGCTTPWSIATRSQPPD